MVKKKVFSVIWTLSILLVGVVLVNLSPTILAETTVLYVDPPSLGGLKVGDIFKINITVSSVVDLYAWQFSLYYRGDVLNATKVEEGPFLKTHPDTDQTLLVTPIFTDSYNSTHGLIITSDTLVGVGGGVNGTGVLATITFKVKQPASSTLHLTGTKLVDSLIPFGRLIPHSTRDGLVYSGLRDVGVVNVQVSSTSVYVGESVRVDVVVANNGTNAETFDVTTYFDSSILGRQTVVGLGAGSSADLIFYWNTTLVQPDRTYVIRAEAQAVLGETMLDNNVFFDGSVTVRSHVPFSIRITEAISCNQSGYAKTRFESGSMAHFKVTVNSTSEEPQTVLVAVNVGDYSNTTLGVVSFKGMIMPGASTFILGLPIPSTVSTGTANMYANAFTDWPYFGGVPYCPEARATFEIAGP